MSIHTGSLIPPPLNCTSPPSSGRGGWTITDPSGRLQQEGTQKGRSKCWSPSSFHLLHEKQLGAGEGFVLFPPWE